MGEICEILDTKGDITITYKYDAYGYIKEITGKTAYIDTIGKLQPLKYKGYINDEETGYYYLQSRYYSPFLKRFISLDDTGILEATQGEILGANLYAYCNNNPTMMIDETGYIASNVIGAIIGGVIGALLGYIIANALNLKGWKKAVFIAAVSVAGAALGAIIGPYIAKASRHIIRVINSGIRKASKAAYKAASSVSKRNIKAKHLSNATGRYRKFNTTNKSLIRNLVSQALRSSNAVFYPDGNGYYIIVNMGKVVGTKGETFIKVCFTAGGFIKTAYPVPR